MQKIKDIEQRLRELELMKQYEGEDKVISSKEAQELYKEPADTFKLDTGFSDMDNLVGGFREGQLIVVSAQTGAGKTTFAQTLTHKFVKKDVDCLWFSYEVGVNEFMEKMGNEKAPIFYLPQTLQQNSVQWLEQRIIEGQAKYDTKVIFIDHLHYLLEMQQMAQARSISLLVGMLMRDLKKLAIKHEIIIFLISHMRKVAYESKKMPEIDDLRDSSFIGQESDLVVFLRREKEGDEYTNFTKVRVAKNRRTGNLGTFTLQFKDNQFYEIDYQHGAEAPQQETSTGNAGVDTSAQRDGGEDIKPEELF